MNSMWQESVSLPIFDSLNKDVKTEVLVIGGGIAGILCAYYLQQSGVDYLLVEGSKIAGGITKNTTAKITSQHGLIYQDLLNKQGKEKAAMYLNANQLAIEQYRLLSKEINCDMEEKDSIVYSVNNEKIIEEEIKALERLGFPAKQRNRFPIPFEIAGAVTFRNQAQFHPLKFIAAITRGLRIYENTFVKKIEGNIASTDCCKITADKIIVTTHFPFINSHGSYFLKMYQHRSYVIALENASEVNGMYVDEAKSGMSFRNYKNLLLIGGGDHRTGKKGGGWEELRSFAAKYYPKAKERFFWAAQDCMSLDQIPYIGNYSKHTPCIYTATGFNKWGMTSSMVAASILKDMVLDKKNEYAEVFSPHRSILKPQLFINGFEAAVNLLTPTPKRCPHLGCALKWNKAEHTWDCPCHGSRFEENGKLIDNPAMKSLRKSY